ncbi:MAG: hypothetical protein ACI8QC_004226 [Planctomycetota bacterium]|jgi:hypothetical protein
MSHRILPRLLAAALCVTPLLAQSSLQDRVESFYGLDWSELQQIEVSGRVDLAVTATLQIEGRSDLLELLPHSVRAAGFQVQNQRDNGELFNVRPEANRNLRGSLVGSPEARVAGALLDDGLYAMILLESGRELWVEPIIANFPDADPNTYVVYDVTAVRQGGHACGSQSLPNNQAQPTQGGQQHQMGVIQVAELAYDTDYEYYLDYGSSGAVQARIELITNTLNLQYESEVNLTHQITSITVRSSSNDPYSSSNASTLLNSFRSHWNNNMTGIQRDIAHLMTGRTIDGGTIGIAWLGVICHGTYGYGLSESDFNGNFSSATDLTAHELGHNWNADHCSCTSNTMNPYITSSNTFHPSFTVPDISGFAAGLSCLSTDTGTPPGQTSNPSPADGATAVSADADLAWGAASGATSYDVYFGSGSNPALLSAGVSNTAIALSTLAYSTTYTWRVDAVNNDGTTAGSLWSFTTEDDPNTGTPPGQVSNPSPADGAASASRDADLSWGAASGATSYDVYFGTAGSLSLVSSGGSATNLALSQLAYVTNYEWRVDAVNATGTTAGPLWGFTTEDAPTGGPTVLFADGFESGGFGAGGWSVSNNKARVAGGARRTGSYGVRLKRTSSISRSVSTAGYGTVTLEYSRRTRNYDNGEFLAIEWFDGSSWNPVETVSSTSWSDRSVTLPAAAANNSSFAIRFSSNANSNKERGDVDDIRVIGA